jgi:diguanylate cyclase (GGDEF)-like protein/PAS domain S-box-containing protein
MAVASLRVRMLLLVLLAVVPALGLILYDGLEARRLEAERAQEQARQLVERLSRDQAQSVAETRQLLVTLAQLPAVRGLDGPACSRLLADIRRQHPRYANIGAIRADGRVFCSAIHTDWARNARDSVWFQRALQTGRFTISDFHFGGISKRAVQTAAYPVADERNGIRVVLFASLDLAWLNRFVAESRLPEGSVIGLMDRRGTVLARFPDPEFWIGENMADTPLAREILTQQQPGLTQSTGMDARRRLYAYTPLSGTASRSAYLYVGIPAEVAYAEPDRALRRNLTGLGLAGLLALTAAWWGGAWLLRKMQPILAATRRLAAGDLSARSGITPRGDEIGQVAHTFDSMAEALQARMLEAMRSTEVLRRQALIFENLTDAVMVLDQDRRIVEWNPACEHLFGFSRSEAIGQTTAILQRSDEFESYGRLVHETIERDGRWSGERTLRRKDGSEIICEAVRVPLRDRDGRVIGRVAINRDITERKRAERALHDSRAELEQAQQVAHIGSWVSEPDENGRLTWSRETAHIFGFAEGTFDHRVQTFLRCVHPDDLERVKQASRAALAGEAPYSIDHRIVRPDGSIRWVHEQADIVRDAAGKAISMVGVVQDITERKLAEERVQYLAYYDALTGLANRSLFQDRLQQAMIDADRYERLVGLIFLDLDRFKNINDTLGHDHGDQLLRAVAERLSGVVRKGDTVARLGGDEFTIVLADMAHVDDAARVAQKILEVFTRPFHVHERELHMTASLGITLYPFDDRNVQDLLRNADIAMYRAKEIGRNTYQFYAADMTARARERLALEGELRQALERRELVLHYQPVVEMTGGAVIGMEALARWQHPTRGWVMPDTFIPVAEESGQILAIGEWVLRTACRQCAQWRRQGFPQLRVAVNLSARQFHQRSLVELIRQILVETELSPAALDLEITESALLQHDEATLTMLKAFRHMGVSLIIDDFGIGYSSLSYLRRFPIRALKIDRSFVRDVPGDPDDAAIVDAVITLARSLGLVVIAEGVETAAQRDYLRARGCSIGQGHFYGEPVPAEELEKGFTLPTIPAP